MIERHNAKVGPAMWRRKRAECGFEKPLQPTRWMTVAAILLLIDAATWAGAVGVGLACTGFQSWRAEKL